MTLKEFRYQTNTTIAMFDTMLAIQPKESGGGGGESRESVVSRQASEMLSKLPKNYDPFEVKERYHSIYCLHVVL